MSSHIERASIDALITAAQTVEIKNALSSLWPSPGCRKINVSFSCLLGVFHHIDTTWSKLPSRLSHLLFYLCSDIEVTHTKTCVDHHIQSTKYMHP